MCATYDANASNVATAALTSRIAFQRFQFIKLQTANVACINLLKMCYMEIPKKNR